MCQKLPHGLFTTLQLEHHCAVLINFFTDKTDISIQLRPFVTMCYHIESILTLKIKVWDVGI